MLIKHWYHIKDENVIHYELTHTTSYQLDHLQGNNHNIYQQQDQDQILNNWFVETSPPLMDLHHDQEVREIHPVHQHEKD